jgi:flavin-dependent dehydrogenase
VNDAIVIGAGPAGSLSALLLARAGWQVTILEQHAFPRDKVCGECLSSRGIEVLRRMGLYEGLQKHEPTELLSVALHAVHGRTVWLTLPRPMMGVSREVLDKYLLNAAASAGAVVRHRVRCEQIEPASRPNVRIRDLVSNQIEILSASHVIVADGKASLFGKLPPPTGDFGIKTHFVGVDGPRDAIEMFGCADCYGGVAAVERDRWNVSFSVPGARLKQFGNQLDELFAELVEENPMLQQRMARAQRASPWLTSAVPRFGAQRPIAVNIIRVGNGSAAMEPICGEGMGVAMRSAELAAIALLEAKGARRVKEHRIAAVARSAAWSVRRNACRVGGLLASSPGASRIALAALENLNLGTSVMRIIGKN